VLAEHPAIRAAAVVGAPDPVVGEIGVAFLVINPDHVAPTLHEVRDWCRSQLADYKSPERVVCVDELPVNAMHKIDKTVLRDQAKEYV
jgi:acyl-CoA synthetase (AMP-forming)/AMP-acid ligase II